MFWDFFFDPPNGGNPPFLVLFCYIPNDLEIATRDRSLVFFWNFARSLSKKVTRLEYWKKILICVRILGFGHFLQIRSVALVRQRLVLQIRKEASWHVCVTMADQVCLMGEKPNVLLSLALNVSRQTDWMYLSWIHYL